MIILKDLINEKTSITAIIVPFRKSDLEYNAEKVKKGIRQAEVIIPILTSKSISNQWVNQEIGFAFGQHEKKNIIPMVEKQILDKLKGFINKEIDINYLFDNESNFSLRAREIVEVLQERYKNNGIYNIKVV